MHPLNVLTHYLLKPHFTAFIFVHDHVKCFPPSNNSVHVLVCHFFHACYVSCPTRSSWLHHTNYTRWGAHTGYTKYYTRCFTMFSVITNIFNKKTKGPTLMELFTATRRLISFLTNRDFRCVHHGWHGTHRCNIQVLAQTRVNMGASIFFTALGQRGLVGGSFEHFSRNELCTLTTDLLVWYSNTQNDFSPGAAIFSLHKLASPSGRNVNYDQKQLTGKTFFELFLISVQVS